MANPIRAPISGPEISGPESPLLKDLSPLSESGSPITPITTPIIRESSIYKPPAMSLKDRIITSISNTRPVMTFSAGLAIGIIIAASLGAVSLGIGIPIAVVFLIVFLGQLAEKDTKKTATTTQLKAKEAESISSNPVGFQNLGNTCFANAVLKAVLNTPNLEHELEKTLVRFPGHPERVGRRTIMRNQETENHYVLRVTLQQDLRDLRQAYLAKDEEMIRTNLRSLFSNPLFADRGLRITRAQEDAYEFLSVIYDALEVADSHRSAFEFQDYQDMRSEEGEIVVSDRVGQPQKTPIVPLRGIINESVSFNRIFNENLHDTLEGLGEIRRELSTSEDTPTSSICFQLPRFRKEFLENGRMRLSKQTGKITELLNPSPITVQLKNSANPTGPSTPTQMRLIPKSFICHEGSTIRSGHYYAYVREADGSWYKHNDSQVRKVKDEEVEAIASKRAYLAFYDTEIIRPAAE